MTTHVAEKDGAIGFEFASWRITNSHGA